jgi:tetratricopeptide (TPR) repeat protein
MQSVSYCRLICLFLLLLQACSNPDGPQRQLSEEDQKLYESFNKNWGQSGPGVDTVRQAIAALPGIDEYRLYCRSWKKARAGNLSGALKTADSLVMAFPSFEKGLFLRAGLRQENGDTAGSQTDFDRCLRRNPSFFEARMNRGALLFSRKMPDLAFQDFRAALSLRPSSPEVLHNLGNACLALGKPDSACRYWASAQKLGSRDASMRIQQFCIGEKP